MIVFLKQYKGTVRCAFGQLLNHAKILKGEKLKGAM